MPICDSNQRLGYLCRAVFVFLLAALQNVSPRLANAQETKSLEIVAALEESLVDTIAKNSKSVVAIARVVRDEDVAPGVGALPSRGGFSLARPGDPDFVPNSYGAGVVIDKAGLILTAYHVLGSSSAGERALGDGLEYWVTLHDRRTLQAKVKAADPRSDLAILEVEASDLATITWGKATTLKPGNLVVALGNPYGIARDGQASAAWGMVANVGRKASPSASDTGQNVKDKLQHFGLLMQTDLKLGLGTSGGPVLNLKGEMVGLTTSLGATPGFDPAASYALPVEETFRRVVETLKQGREVEYGFLGIEPENLREDEMRSGLRGVRVRNVIRGTPAHRLDLRSTSTGANQADIITHVDGAAVYDADSLVLSVGKRPVESAVKLNVLRGTEKLQLATELMKLPVRGKRVVTTREPAWRGLRVDYWTALPDFQRRMDLREIDAEGCVMVLDVEKGSAAAAAGLKPEMLITRVGARVVRSPAEFRKAVAGEAGVVKLKVRISDETKDFSIGPPK